MEIMMSPEHNSEEDTAPQRSCILKDKNPFNDDSRIDALPQRSSMQSMAVATVSSHKRDKNAFHDDSSTDNTDNMRDTNPFNECIDATPQRSCMQRDTNPFNDDNGTDTAHLRSCIKRDLNPIHDDSSIDNSEEKMLNIYCKSTSIDCPQNHERHCDANKEQLLQSEFTNIFLSLKIRNKTINIITLHPITYLL
jgi:hypothetical protein